MNFDQLVAWFRSTSFGESWPPWGPLCLWQCFILSLWSFAFAYFCAEFQFDSFEIQQKDGLCQVLETRVYKNITIWEILPSAPDQFDHFLWGVSWPFFRVSRRLQIIGADCCPCTDSRVERGAAFLAKVDVPTLPTLPPRPPGQELCKPFDLILPIYPQPPPPSPLKWPRQSCFLVTYDPAALENVRLINLLHLARRARPATAFRAQRLT